MRASRNTVGSKADTAAPAPPLRIAFPQVAELRIEFDFMPESGWAPSTQVHILHPPARASFRYPCPFAGCTGWFELEAPVTQLLREVAKDLSADICCIGVRPRDRSSGKLCGAQLNYRITATYTSPATRAHNGR